MLTRILELAKREPAVLLAVLTTGLALAASFGLDLTKDQTSGLVAFAVAIGTVLTRALVTPNVSVAAKQDSPANQVVAGQAADVFEGTPVDVVPAQTETLPFDERGSVSLGRLAFWTVVVVVVIVVFMVLL